MLRPEVSLFQDLNAVCKEVFQSIKFQKEETNE
jgi:hypothetical protein